MKLLIVDDEPFLQTTLADMLAKQDYEVFTADDGKAAFDFLMQQDEPVVVLLDWVMPVMNGIELCRRLENQKRRSCFYIILLTVINDKEAIASALDAGADDFITKPVHPRELISRLAVGRRMLEYQYALEKMTEELITANCCLQQMAMVDGLTGIFNRRYFDGRLIDEWCRALREGQWLSLVFIDVDYFKFYNDIYGHPAGDRCLQKISAAVTKTLYRAGDIAARHGGEEFAVLLPNTDPLGAMVVAEALRIAVSQLNIKHQYSPCGKVTISLGVASVVPVRNRSPESLLSMADQALYLAKAGGRNSTRHYRDIKE